MAINRIRVRKRENPYLQLDKTVIEDKRLTMRARGLHAYLMSRPDTWVVYITQLEQAFPAEGKYVIRKTLKELETHGYIARHRVRNARGQLCGWDTHIYETPELASLDTSESTPKAKNCTSVDAPKCNFPTSDNPTSDNPTSEDCTLVINDTTNAVQVVSIESNKPPKPPVNGGLRRTRTEDKPEARAQGLDPDVKALIRSFTNTHRMDPPQRPGALVQANDDGEIEDDARREQARRRKALLRAQAAQLEEGIR